MVGTTQIIYKLYKQVQTSFKVMNPDGSLLGQVSDDFGRRTKVLREKTPTFVKGRHVASTAPKRYPPSNHWNPWFICVNTQTSGTVANDWTKTWKNHCLSLISFPIVNSGTQITSTQMRVNQLQLDSWRAYMNTMQCIPLHCISHIEHIYIHWTWHFPPSKLLSI